MTDYPSLPVLSAAQMRACDTFTMRTVPSRVLMERAAAAVVRCVDELSASGTPALVLCGGGNNGGDGFAAARFLSAGTYGPVRSVSVLYLGRLTTDGTPDADRMSAECARQYALCRDADVSVLTLPDDAAVDELIAALAMGSIVIDAVFGIGLDRPVDGLIARVFRSVKAAGVPVTAVDIPSGVNADTGCVMGEALSCAATVTMQALKPGLLLWPGAGLCGAVTVADIGVDLSGAPEEHPIRLTGLDELKAALPPRARRTHKGTYGNLALCVGSRGMAGAAVLSVSAALHSGAGLVTAVTPQANRVILQTTVPEAVLCLYNGRQPDLRALRKRLFRTDGKPAFDGLVIGCGLGTSACSLAVLSFLLDALLTCPAVPVVLDADALNLLAQHPELWETGLLACPDKRVVITPHPAEMSRLCGSPVPDILSDLPGIARAFAHTHGVTVVLKDAHTVTAGPDGSLYISAAGNAGMAGGGSGDVLAGIIGALLTQNRDRIGDDLPLTMLAAAGVLLHGMAGDEAARTSGEYGMSASYILSALPAVTRSLSDSRTIIKQYP